MQGGKAHRFRQCQAAWKIEGIALLGEPDVGGRGQSYGFAAKRHFIAGTTSGSLVIY
jgi:hypothetical protein